MIDVASRSLSLIIPVYHEGSDVYPVLESHYDYLTNHFDTFEIIIALDGDDEETRLAIEKFKNERENVRVHHSSVRRGKGGAILDSFSVVRFGTVVLSDADTSIAPTEIGKLVHSLHSNGVDVAIGSRYVKGSRRIISVKRLILSRFFNIIVRLFTGLTINDTQCGTKAISSKYLPVLIHYQSESGWAFDVQMLYILKSVGARIIEVPIDWIFAEGSRLKLGNDVPKMFLSVIKARFLNKKNV